MKFADIPRISVVVPSLNQGRFIEQTLLSIFGQGYPNLEVLVMDGGSTDGTVDILKRYEGQLAYWRSAPDAGQAAAINEGFKRASGNVFCWLNSDDMYLPSTLIDVGSRLRGRVGQPLLLYGCTINLHENGGKVGISSHLTGVFSRDQITQTDPISQPSAFWTRALWEATGKLDDVLNYAFDWEWFIRAHEQGAFEHVQRFYSIYRWHGNHKSAQGGGKRRQEIVDVVRRHGSRYWGDLYEEVALRCDRLNRVARWLGQWGVPRPRSWAMLTAPSLLWRARHVRDIRLALGMV